MAQKRPFKGPQLPGLQGLPTMGAEQNPGMTLNMAMIVAAQDGCGCRACQLLRKVNDQMVQDVLKEE